MCAFPDCSRAVTLWFCSPDLPPSSTNPGWSTELFKRVSRHVGTRLEKWVPALTLCQCLHWWGHRAGTHADWDKEEGQSRSLVQERSCDTEERNGLWLEVQTTGPLRRPVINVGAHNKYAFETGHWVLCRWFPGSVALLRSSRLLMGVYRLYITKNTLYLMKGLLAMLGL